MYFRLSTDAVQGGPRSSFPRARATALQPPPGLAARGISLRWLGDGDDAWLRDLYASTREQEFVGLGWDEGARRAFLDQQFDLQHRHYLAHFPDADFLAVCQSARPLGRLYLRPSAPSHLLVDISLFPDARNQGIGRGLIAAAQRSAASQGCGMHLHVTTSNPDARRLYERLGFGPGAIEGAYLRMDWDAGPAGVRSVEDGLVQESVAVLRDRHQEDT
ncbi:GNAT family N-acetyltransferase [Luteimonas sp. SDU101]|uniref:GNAT family N-acetyltransferase n=1 Tax=Luteimonas sp. SDU101 TaxID=3422593 RepID=UPI003EBDA0CC